jgi:hypothetical protein
MRYYIALKALPLVQNLYPNNKIKVGPLWAWGFIPKAIAQQIQQNDPAVGTGDSLLCPIPKLSK